MKSKCFVGFCVLLVLGFVLVGCDTGTNGGGGGDGLTLTIINNYTSPITKLDMNADDCTIDDLSAISENPSGSHIYRDYEYTTSIAAGSSKSFTIKADAGKTQPSISVLVTAEGLDPLDSIVSGLYGESYNHHFTVTVFLDGAVEGDFEK